MSSEEVNVVATGLIERSVSSEDKPGPEEGLWLLIRGDFPLREGVPRGVVELGLGCILKTETGFFGPLVAILSVFRERLVDGEVLISYSADNRLEP
jgi:hypothetical protein